MDSEIDRLARVAATVNTCTYHQATEVIQTALGKGVSSTRLEELVNHYPWEWVAYLVHVIPCFPVRGDC